MDSWFLFFFPSSTLEGCAGSAASVRDTDGTGLYLMRCRRIRPCPCTARLSWLDTDMSLHIKPHLMISILRSVRGGKWLYVVSFFFHDKDKKIHTKIEDGEWALYRKSPNVHIRELTCEG